MREEILQLYSSQYSSESLAIKILLSTTGPISGNSDFKNTQPHILQQHSLTRNAFRGLCGCNKDIALNHWSHHYFRTVSVYIEERYVSTLWCIWHLEKLLVVSRREIITVRGQSYVFRLPKYWYPAPTPLSARWVCNVVCSVWCTVPLPLFWGEDTLAGWRGGWGVNILEDARHSSVLYLYRILFVVTEVLPLSVSQLQYSSPVPLVTG